ncbi:uncharacterized protein LOC117295143 [Asterias rubens]|uniref:uncharacterized protein LOC117295143 n=1 Tax=Asterias rubens TaxID=7604 RepID=UPI0014558634|nr:uncharacterized protein LOC117295143 [Asterias rubens]
MASFHLILVSLIALMAFPICHSEVTEDSMMAESTTLDAGDMATEIVTEIVTVLDDDSTAMTTAASGDSTTVAVIDGSTAAATTASSGLTTEASASDLEAYALTVTSPTDLIFDIGVDNIVTYSIDLRNAGGTDIASSASGNNFALSFLISSHADPSDVDASTLMFDAETSNSDNLDAGITAGSTITVSTASAMINIPSDDCETYQYTCVEVSKVDTAVFTDSVSTNNYVCLGFGDVAEGLAGIKTCSGCALQVSIVLLLAASVVSKLLS